LPGLPIQFVFESILMNLCNLWNAALVEMFISLGVGCEVRGTGGMSPLHVASSGEMVSAHITWQSDIQVFIYAHFLMADLFAFESVRS
jgi:hypothetical protein